LRKLSNHPLDALNSVFLGFWATFLAYSCTIGPDTRFFALTLTNHSHTISLTSSFTVFLSYLFIFPLAQFSHRIKISVFFFRISYTWVLPTLNIFMICLTDNLSRSLAWITFTLVLRSSTNLVFVAMMTTARLSKNVRLGPLLCKISGRGKQFSWISVQVVQYCQKLNWKGDGQVFRAESGKSRDNNQKAINLQQLTCSLALPVYWPRANQP